MAKTKSEIHEFHAARKLNILKGFNETSFNPPVHIQKLKETHGEENVYTLEMLKGYTDSALEKGDVSSILSAQDDLSALTAVAGINERGIKQTFYIEKGKKALVGEIRTWKGKKYRKKANGKWERVVETVTRDYVDEDTGEIYSITHEVEPEKSHEEEMRELEMRYDGNKTRQRKQRKADKKEKKVAEKRRDLEYDLDAMAEEYQDLKRELKQLDSDMNAEAGMMGENWNDDKANEYGGKMMEVEAKMEALIPQIKKLKVEIENYEEKEAEIWSNSPQGLDAERRRLHEWNREKDIYNDLKNQGLTKAIDDILDDADTLLKGHMDFDSSGGGGRSGLVKKQLTDKTGRQTTRWVRANEDESGEKEKQPVEDETSEGKKPVSEHAKETSSEDLKKYLENNPDGEHANHAKRELQIRGEEGQGEVESEGVEVDYSNPESVREALANHEDRDSIIDYAIEHGVTPGQAMKMMDANKQDHSETHAAIDEAQNSLNALKEKTGHPETEQSEESEEGGKDYMDDWQYSMDEFLNTDFGDDEYEMASQFVEIADEIAGFDPEGERLFNTGMEVIANNMEAGTLYEALNDADAHPELIEWLEESFNEMKGGRNISYDEWKAQKDGAGGPEMGDDEDGFDNEDPEYRLEMYTHALDDVGPDEDTVGDFIQGLMDIEVANENTSNAALYGMKKIAEGMDEQEFMDILRSETSDESAIHDIVGMYRDAKGSTERNGIGMAGDEPETEEEQSNRVDIAEAQQELKHAMDDLDEYYGENPDAGMPGEFEEKWGERVSQIIEESGMTEDQFREVTKKYQGLAGVIYSDYAKNTGSDDSKKKDDTVKRKTNWTRSGNFILSANADDKYYDDASVEDHEDVIEHFSALHSGGTMPDLDAIVEERVNSHSEAAERKRKSK